MSQPPPDHRPKPVQRRSGVVTPHRARWHERLAARAIWLVALALGATIRWSVVDRCNLLGTLIKERALFAIWHNRLALCLLVYRRYVVRPGGKGRRLAALVSASRDGGLLARVLELFDVRPVRGSSSRRGAQALMELTTAAEDGFDLAVTPDGPRGPCYRVQEGVIAAAQLTGYPIIPVSYRMSPKKTLKSWDRFQVPLPFSRCEVWFAEPIHVPSDATEDDRKRLRDQLEKALIGITHD